MFSVSILHKVFVVYSVAHPTFISTSPLDSVNIANFRIKTVDDHLEVILEKPSGGATVNDKYLKGKTRWPIALGVQLKNYGIHPKEAEYLGNNKIAFGAHTTLGLKKTKAADNCVEVLWNSHENQTLEDCFQLGPHNWYGGPENADQYWPIERATFEESSYVTKAEFDQAICEPYWLNSDGFMIYVDPTVPLFIDQNHHQNDSLCLLAKHEPPYSRQGGPTLKYTMCKFDNPRVAHEFAIKTFLGKPSGIPDTRMVQHPIWSTWAKYKTNINEDVVMKYAKEIKDHGFNNSQLEIDDMWETCYGSLSFNKNNFPNMRKLTADLKNMGFRTTLWVHPFINLDCETHKEAADKGYLTKNTEGNTTTSWWNGVGSYIDFTNPAAADWFEKRLRRVLSENGIDSFKFDAGESSWPPQVPVLNVPESEQPEAIAQKYVQVAAKFGPMIEVRVGRGFQNIPVFVRMLDRNSVWGDKNAGLGTVIPTTFQMNLNGYPFVLPDMVGGNAYGDQNVTKEMFLRYLQLNVFLPAIQFSIPPWDFDSETVELSKKFTALRYEYAGTIVALMRNAVQTGQPINPPIWWVDPTDREAHKVSSEYLLGEDILVAPVLEEGATSRDIYLPKGQWRDEARTEKPVLSGPIWLRNYSAPLEILPYFTRVSSTSITRTRTRTRAGTRA